MKTNKLLTGSVVFFLLIASLYSFFLLPKIAAQDSNALSSPPPQPIALTKYCNNPVIVMPSWAKDASLLRVNNTWYAAITYRDPQTGSRSVRMLNSTDFHYWKDMGITISPTLIWEGNVAAAPALYYDSDNAMYYCFYHGNTVGIGGIGYAYSSNIANSSSWIKSTDPVITPTPGAWDSAQTYDPDVVKVGNTYYLYYIGTTQNTVSINRQLGVATSNSIVGPYKKYSGNPIFVNNDSYYIGNQKGIEGWEVFRHGNFEYAQSVMWEASGNCSGSQKIALYYATDDSMLNWALLNESFITPSQTWETNAIGNSDAGVGHSGFYIVGDTLNILYQGKSSSDWAIGEATAEFQNASSTNKAPTTPIATLPVTETPTPTTSPITETPTPTTSPMPIIFQSFPTLQQSMTEATQATASINSENTMLYTNRTVLSTQTFVETTNSTIMRSSSASPQLFLQETPKLQQINFISKTNYVLWIITGSMTLATVTLMLIKRQL